MSAGGKGSGRRPTLVPEAEVADSWKTIFGNKKNDSIDNRNSGTNAKEETNQPSKGTCGDADSVSQT